MTEQVPASPDFEHVFRNNFAFVCRLLRRLGVLESDMADVAQELFVALHPQLIDWDSSKSIRPWLAGFCLRFASNYRKLARHRGSSLDEVNGRALASNEHAVIEARQTVAHVLSLLPFEQRTALVLHDMEGLTAPEIAEITHVPLPTVYSRVRLARERAREILAGMEGGEAP